MMVMGKYATTNFIVVIAAKSIYINQLLITEANYIESNLSFGWRLVYIEIVDDRGVLSRKKLTKHDRI